MQPDLKNKKILVLGNGKSGKSVCRLLQSKNCEVQVLENANKFEKNISFSAFDFFVVSPGINLKKTKIYKKLKKYKNKIISELDVAFLFCTGTVIAVSGTNGKTTTTSLICNALKKSGQSACVAGNIGVAFCDVCENGSKFFVVECSSFQLEYSKYFKPTVALLLNFSPDHLERHKTLNNYLNCKLKLFKNNDNLKLGIFNNNYFISNKLNKNIKKTQKELQKTAKINYFSINKINNGIYYNKNIVFNSINNSIYKLFKLPKNNLKGEKNIENILACECVCKFFNLPCTKVVKAIGSFIPDKCRIDAFYKENGVTYIDDSKATNISSTLCAINAINSTNIILLLGGISKNQNFDKLFLNKEFNIKTVIFFGKDADLIEKSYKKLKKNNYFKFNSLFLATKKAKEIAESGDIVLLSPACSSFDEFKNFEDRGDCFKAYAKNQAK